MAMADPLLTALPVAAEGSDASLEAVGGQATMPTVEERGVWRGPSASREGAPYECGSWTGAGLWCGNAAAAMDSAASFLGRKSVEQGNYVVLDDDDEAQNSACQTPTSYSNGAKFAGLACIYVEPLQSIPVDHVSFTPVVSETTLSGTNNPLLSVTKDLEQSPKSKSKQKNSTCSTNPPLVERTAGQNGTRELVERTLRMFHALRRKYAGEGEYPAQEKVSRPDLKACVFMKQKNLWVNTKKWLGPVPGIEVGDHFYYRVELCVVGLHRQIQGGIDYITAKENPDGLTLAASICCSGGYGDELEDDGETIVYTGQGGNNYKSDRRAKEDQKLERGNLALFNSCDKGSPVRVIKGKKDRNSPIGLAYVYDGLYKVVRTWLEKNSAGFGVYKFKLQRVPGQPQSESVEKIAPAEDVAMEEMINKMETSMEDNVISEEMNSATGENDIAMNKIDTPMEENVIIEKVANKLKTPRAFKRPSTSNGCGCVGECSDPQSCAILSKSSSKLPFAEALDSSFDDGGKTLDILDAEPLSAKKLTYNGASSSSKKRKSSDLLTTWYSFDMPSSSSANEAREAVKAALRTFETTRRKIIEDDAGPSSKKILRPDLRAAVSIKEKNLWVNTGKYIGSVPGVEVGDYFYFRIELCVVGLHRQIQAGIDFMSGKYNEYGVNVAASICSSGGYHDDIDDGETLVYTGQGGNNYKADKRQKENQKLERGNLALSNSFEKGLPVRVIRGCKHKGSPSGVIYTYDGLYKVEKSWFEKGLSGFGIYKFKLHRLPGQPGLASKLGDLNLE